MAAQDRGSYDAWREGTEALGSVKVETGDSPRGGRIATVCHDNEARLNVIDRESAEALSAAIRQAGRSPDVRVIVLRGAGGRAFIGGADIREMVDLTPETSRSFISAIHGICAAIRGAPIPVVARLSGYCLGAGLEVAASCDLRVADATAKFAMPEVQVGIPSVIEAALLPRLVGWGRASRLIYTGETIGAERAHDWGLVDSLVPEGGLDDEIARTADMICAAGPVAIRLQKALLRDWEELPLREAVERSIDCLAKGFASGEARERMSAFLNRKR